MSLVLDGTLGSLVDGSLEAGVIGDGKVALLLGGLVSIHSCHLGLSSFGELGDSGIVPLLNEGELQAKFVSSTDDGSHIKLMVKSLAFASLREFCHLG